MHIHRQAVLRHICELTAPRAEQTDACCSSCVVRDFQAEGPLDGSGQLPPRVHAQGALSEPVCRYILSLGPLDSE